LFFFVFFFVWLPANLADRGPNITTNFIISTGTMDNNSSRHTKPCQASSADSTNQAPTIAFAGEAATVSPAELDAAAKEVEAAVATLKAAKNNTDAETSEADGDDGSNDGELAREKPQSSQPMIPSVARAPTHASNSVARLRTLPHMRQNKSGPSLPKARSADSTNQAPTSAFAAGGAATVSAAELDAAAREVEAAVAKVKAAKTNADDETAEADGDDGSGEFENEIPISFCRVCNLVLVNDCWIEGTEFGTHPELYWKQVDDDRDEKKAVNNSRLHVDKYQPHWPLWNSIRKQKIAIPIGVEVAEFVFIGHLIMPLTSCPTM
jgi:hypothetical protein